MKRLNMKTFAPLAALLLAFGTASCTSDLDSEPISPKIDLESSADGLFNKCYSVFAMAGNGDGDTGDANSDVKGYNDEGMTNLVRLMWNANELTTDEAICGWGDNGIDQLVVNTYDNSNQMMKAYFSRLSLSINNCNTYLEQYGDYNATMTAEVRFLRALLYATWMDAFGNIPFTEVMGKPAQYTRAEMFNWLITELTENVEPNLSEAKAKKSTDANYGRVDKAAAWLLLARLYLNAEVYTGTAQWEKARSYAEMVINSDYELNTNGVGQWSAYQMLFMGDNGETNAAKEAIFPILQDSKNIRSYGNSLFLIASTFKDDMHANPSDPAAINGCVSAAWAGNRARPTLINKFFPLGNAPQTESYNMPYAAGDDRAIFWGVERTLDCTNISSFADGYSVCKFVSFKTDGSSSYNPSFTDTDFFLMRKAEAYLTYAEADAHLNGDKTSQTGTRYINLLRARANASTRNESTDSYNMNDILDEWSREFYFEGRRRMDLIRHGKFGGNNDYNWQWKGNSFDGAKFADFRNVFPIPVSELNSNSALKQNPGY